MQIFSYTSHKEYPIAQIKRNNHPQNATILTTRGKLPGGPNSMWSGQAISFETDDPTTLRLGVDPANPNPVIGFLWHNLETDNLANGTAVMGLPGGDFRIRTPFFLKGDGLNYRLGTPITYCVAADVLADGDVNAVGAPYAAAGWWKAAAVGDKVVGHIIQDGIMDLMAGPGRTIQSDSIDPARCKAIVFDTCPVYTLA